MADLNQIAESLSSLTIMEAADLAKLLEEKWGVSAAAPVAVAAAAGPGAEAAVEKDEFDVVLISSGDKKIQVIKEVRAITSLGLSAVLPDGPSSICVAHIGRPVVELRGRARFICRRSTIRISWSSSKNVRFTGRR